MVRSFLKTLAAVCAVVTVIGANAATVSNSFPIASTYLELNQTSPLALFDSNLGTLTGATLTITANVTREAGDLRNSSNTAQRYRLIQTSNVGITSTLTPVNQLFNHSSDFSLVIDTGLLTLPALTVYPVPESSNSKEITIDLGATLSAVSAAGGGSFSISCASVTEFSAIGGGGNLDGVLPLTGGCGATITYTYDPTPVVPAAPVSVPVGGAGMLGLMGLAMLGLASRLRRKAR